VPRIADPVRRREYAGALHALSRTTVSLTGSLARGSETILGLRLPMWSRSWNARLDDEGGLLLRGSASSSAFACGDTEPDRARDTGRVFRAIGSRVSVLCEI
jgi:hypothetical protein